MSFHVQETDDSVIILADDFRMVWSRDHNQWNDNLQIRTDAGWQMISCTSWHLLLRTPEAPARPHFFSELQLVRQNPESVELKATLA